MNRYTIYCTPEQTKKALELGAPIEIVPHDYDRKSKYTAIENKALKHPTAEQMIGWLEGQNKIRILIDHPDEAWTFDIFETEKDTWITGVHGQQSREEVTLDAIDAALDYLLNNK